MELVDQILIDIQHKFARREYLLFQVIWVFICIYSGCLTDYEELLCDPSCGLSVTLPKQMHALVKIVTTDCTAFVRRKLESTETECSS